MNDDQPLPAEGEDEPDSPVFSLTSKGVFDADLIIRDDRWLVIVDAACRDITTTAIAAALRTARDNKASGAAEFSILLADDAMLAHLNSLHRGKDGPTNVLSFPDDDGGAIGDIAIAYETVIKEAAAQEKSSRDHLLHLIIHGVLHLLGHDHLEDGEAMIMEGIEAEILTGLGIADPYQEGRPV